MQVERGEAHCRYRERTEVGVECGGKRSRRRRKGNR